MLIATCNRNQLLLQRSLPSVFNQNQPPQHLVIVDDSDDISDLETILAATIPKNLEFTFLKNHRTKGASGAWNTGLEFITKFFGDEKNIFIAILDDDDEWTSEHLATCSKYTFNNDVIISGLVHHNREEIYYDNIPNELNINELLVRNPGVQGANTFVRLSCLLEAGLFDENLLSSTDRDLCIRLADVKARCISTGIHTVHHYSDSDRRRLSSYGSPQKLDGLQVFWQKYKSRMDDEQKQNFLERSKNLFGFVPSKKSPISFPSTVIPDSQTPFDLIVAVISDDAQQLAPLLEDLRSLQSQPSLKSLEVIVMYNGGNEEALLNLTENMIKRGLPCYFVHREQQVNDALQGAFGKPFRRGLGQLSIGKSRTILQRYLYEFISQKPDSIAWILDDDMRLDDRARFYLSWLPEFRKIKVDVLLGSYEGASPNPPSNGIRVQLVDFVNNLIWLDKLNPDDILPDRSEENRQLRLKYPDYYYDLSRAHTAHLETIYWLTPAYSGETVFQARKRLIDSAINFLAGEPLTRPLVADLPTNPITEARDSVNRGGNTFILNPQALQQAPNAIIEISGQEARRSDMLWAIINRYYYGMTIKQIHFPVLHRRNIYSKPQLNIRKVIEEIQGSSVYAALKEILEGHSLHDFEFDDVAKSTICKKVHEYIAKRLSAFRLSYFRIQGICKYLKHYNHEELNEFTELLSSWYNKENLHLIISGVQTMSDEHIHHFIGSLKDQIQCYANSQVGISFLSKQKEPKKKNLLEWCSLPTPFGDFRMYDTGDENLRLVSVGDIFKISHSPAIRIHSSCIASEIFKSVDCDCADQLEESMKYIASQGEGLIFHLQQEGRGHGLSNKIKAISLMQKKDIDTVESFDMLNLEQDVRNYQKVIDLLLELKITSVKLITNNPRKVLFLKNAGISVTKIINTTPKVRKENRDYLYTKRDKLNHTFCLER